MFPEGGENKASTGQLYPLGGFCILGGDPMNTQDFKRKLTAVFSADVAGYNRLMGEDEAATVKTLEAYKQVMFALIKQQRGRVVDSPGDNLLAEFASVVDAVQCGVAVQNELKARNADLLENRRMQFRIGINLGDVIEEGDRIYGDGVNIAARLESLADPGGICISKTAFDQIETKLPLGSEYLGDQTVKNIAKPVGAYRVLMEPRVTVAGAKDKKPSVPLPDKPSIAVLPFVNMSTGPGQEFFAAGLSESIITALAKVPKLFVIGLDSPFSSKGKTVTVSQIAEELGVQYVLEGSVQKEGDRVRITAHLIDALKGHHLWADRYDREPKDLFAIQDDITKNILTSIQVKLTHTEFALTISKGTKNIDAYLKVLEAQSYAAQTTRESIDLARQLAEEAIAMDPGYESAYFVLGTVYMVEAQTGFSKNPKESRN